MSALYSVTFDAAVTLATDLFHVTVGADRPVTIHAIELGQNSDVQDAAEEILKIGVYRAVTGGSGGTAATENTYADDLPAAASAAVLTNNTTASTAGTLLHIIGWNIRIPLLWVPTPEMRMTFDAGADPVSFRIITAPADSLSMWGTLVWEE